MPAQCSTEREISGEKLNFSGPLAEKNGGRKEEQAVTWEEPRVGARRHGSPPDAAVGADCGFELEEDDGTARRVQEAERVNLDSGAGLRLGGASLCVPWSGWLARHQGFSFRITSKKKGLRLCGFYF
jgi:hypothetical protein